jgi:NlpC/P60 family putative phage cell wall peptidase
MISRAQIVASAREWIGTPYHHQASLKGIGCDCLGLVRGVWRDLYGDEPERPPSYTPSWGQGDGRELMLEAAGRHLLALGCVQGQAGDMLVFRMRETAAAKHCGIVSYDGRMVHAYSNAAVCETMIGDYWKRRCVGVFAFPDIGGD